MEPIAFPEIDSQKENTEGIDFLSVPPTSSKIEQIHNDTRELLFQLMTEIQQNDTEIIALEQQAA